MSLSSTKASKNSARIALCQDLGQLYMMLLGGSDGILVGFPIVEVNAGILLDGLDHRQAFPVTHVDLLATVGDLGAAADLEGQALVHLSTEIHLPWKSVNAQVQLDGRELGVMWDPCPRCGRCGQPHTRGPCRPRSGA